MGALLASSTTAAARHKTLREIIQSSVENVVVVVRCGAFLWMRILCASAAVKLEYFQCFFRECVKKL